MVAALPRHGPRRAAAPAHLGRCRRRAHFAEPVPAPAEPLAHAAPRHRSTHTVGPDFAYALCTRLVTDEQLAALDLSALEGVITGAEPVRAGTLAAFAERFAPAGFRARAFIPAYGMAETTLLVTASVRDRAVSALHAGDALERGELRPAAAGERATELVSCGPPAAGHEVAIVDALSGRRAGPGAVGEILVRGPSVAKGYWQRGRMLRRRTFGATIAGESGDRAYLRTGDLGALVDGELVITGRIRTSSSSVAATSTPRTSSTSPRACCPPDASAPRSKGPSASHWSGSSPRSTPRGRLPPTSWTSPNGCALRHGGVPPS